MGNEVLNLMNLIKRADVQPSVYKVFVAAADHFEGFHAWVDFRSNVKGGADGLSAHGDTPEEALAILKNELFDKFGKCPHCNSYKKSAA